MDELRSSKHINSIFAMVVRCIVMVFNYLVRSAVFEGLSFAVAGIISYFLVYRWCRRWKD